MLKVSNKKIFREIASKTYKANKKRNFLLIGATFFTTFLLVTLLSIGMNYWDVLQNRSIQMNGMDYDISLSEPTEEQVVIAKQLPEITDAGVVVKCGIISETATEKIGKIQLFWLDDTAWQKQCQPALTEMKGNYPQNGNEILLSISALKSLGITKPQIGMSIEVKYTPLSQRNVNGELLSATFILSGYFTDLTGREKGFVSEKFYKETGAKQTDFTQGNLNIRLKKSLYFKREILAIQKKFKLSEGQYLSADDEASSSFVKTMLVIVGLVGMIFLSGYLIIYNTLKISVVKDIQYYGQLKTIGTTSKQLKKIIYYQAFRNGFWGILFGGLASVLTSFKLLPTILNLINSEFQLDKTNISALLGALFIGIIFSGFTIFMGSNQPAKLVGNYSPIAALSYHVSTQQRSKVHRKHFLFWFALQNIFRDKKQAVTILISLSLSLMLSMIIQVVILENNGKIILNQIQPTDLQVRNETTLDEEGKKDLITVGKIAELEKMKGIKSVEAVHSWEISLPYQKGVFDDYYQKLYDSRYAPGNYQEDMKKYQEGDVLQVSLFSPRLIGLDGESFRKIQPSLSEKVGVEAFESGKVAIVDAWLSFVPEDAIGKEINFYLQNVTGEKLEVTTKIVSIGDNPAYFGGGYTPNIMVSEAYFETLTQNKFVELINIQYEKTLSEKTEEEMRQLFSGTPSLSFDSKLENYQEMQVTEGKVSILGNSLSFIVSLLALLNFIYTISASIENRRQEFALLEGVGMTRKQLLRVLMMEGLFYGLFATFIAFCLGFPISYFVFQNLNIYQIQFRFAWGSSFLLCGFVLLICFIFPAVFYQWNRKVSLIEDMHRIS